jgi:hypothetical protein
MDATAGDFIYDWMFQWRRFFGDPFGDVGAVEVLAVLWLGNCPFVFD